MKAIYYFFVLGFLFLLFSKEAIANNKSSNRIYDLKENISLFNQDTIRVCGSSYTLDAGQGFNSYLWNTGATTSSIFITNSGWYKCVVDGSVSDSVFMLFYDASIKNNDTSICIGNSVLLQSNYLFSNNNIRYIKFSSTYSADNGQVNVYEIQAYRNGINIALNKSGYANSYEYGNWSSNGKSAIDGDGFSRWSSNRNDPGPDLLNPHYIVIDLLNIYSIDSIILNIEGFDSHNQNFKIFVSSDANNWNVIGEGTDITGIFTYRLNLNLPPSPFTWSTGQSTASISVFPTQTTTYYTSFNNGSCIQSDSVTIIVNQSSTSTTNVSLCPNQLPYQWNGLSINAAGIYNKTLVNSVGCDSLARLVLTVSYPNLFIEDTIRVCGNTRILDAGIGYAFYQWNTGASTQSIETRTSGWNKCAVSNDGICYGSDSVYMIFYDASIKNNDTSICTGNSVLLQSNYSNNNIRYIKFSSTFSADNGQVNVYEIQAYRNGVNVALNKSGNANSYEYGNWDSNGMNAIDGGEFSRWSSNRNDPGPDSLNPHYIVIDLQNIYTIDSIILNIKGFDSWAQNFKLSASNDAINWYTIGEGTNITGIFTYKLNSINLPPTNFSWSTGQSMASITVYPTQTTTYYTILNNGSCFQRDSITVIVNQPPTFNPFIEDTIRVCGGSYILNSGSGFVSYLWNTNDTIQSISASNSGQYKCVVSVDSVCNVSDSVFMIFYNADIKNNDTTICMGSSVLLQSNYSNNNIRFIKFSSTYSSDNGQVNVYEIQAYQNGFNIALNKTGYDYRGYHNINDAIDGNGFSRWSSDRNDPGPDSLNPHFLLIDLQNIYFIDSVILNIKGFDGHTQNFKISVSADNTNWDIIGEGTNNTGSFIYRLNTVNLGQNTFSWSNGETTSSISVTPLQTSTYYTNFNSEGCTQSDSIIVYVNQPISLPPSAITGSKNISRCDTLQNYSVYPITGSTFTWSVTGRGNYLFSGQGTNAVTIVMKVAGTISVKATNACGIVSSATTVSVINVRPTSPGSIYQRFIPAIVTANANTCLFTQNAFTITGVADTFRIKSVAKATGYLWKTPSGSIVTRVNDTTIAVVFSNSITIPDSIKVYTLSSCDTSLARVLPLKKVATSIPGLIYNNNGVIANSDVCSNIGSSVIYKIRKVSTATYYNWYMTRGNKATITHINPLGVNDTAIIVNYQTGFTADSINVSCSNGCGTSALKLLRVSAILPPPTPLKITASTGNFYPCRTNIVQYAATSPVATTAQSPSVVYRWTRPANTTITLSNADSSVITIRFESNYAGGSLSVKCQTACGIQGSAKSQALYYTPPTPTGINSDAGYNVCIGSTVSLTCADPVSGGTGETSTQTQTPITMHHWTKPNFTSITSATVDSGTISLLILTGFTGGNVSAKCQSSCGVTGTAKSQTLSLSACPTVAKNSNAYTGVMASFEVNIFPNPTKSAFNLQVSSTSREAFSVKVLDVQGRLIKSMIVFASEINNIGNDLKSGVYMFEITQGKEKKTVRVVKY